MNQEQKINFIYNFIWTMIICLIFEIIISGSIYYLILTEKVSTVKKYEFGYCDDKVIDVPKNSIVICSKEGMDKDYSFLFHYNRKIFSCLSFGEATCLVKTTERRWK